MQQELMLPVILVLALTGLLLVMLLYLTVRKTIGNRHRRRLESAMDVMRQPVFEWLQYGTATRHLRLTPSMVVHEAAELLLEQYTRVLSGDEFEARIRAFADSQFTSQYRERLRKPGRGTRLNTLRRIERFDMRHMEADLIGLLADPRKFSKMTTGEIALTFKLLARWDSDEMLPMLRQSRFTCSVYEGRLIAAGMSESALSRLLTDREAYPEAWILVAIDVIGLRRLEGMTDELLSLLEHPDSEFRIRSLKALSELSLVPADPRFLQHAQSGQWEERNMAAKLFGKLRDPIYTQPLLGLLSDPSWFVRSQAAQSIMQYPNGQALLQHAAEHAEDRYARDMAAEWKGRGLPNA